jgi:murein DD-endopeptidase MepM/ murein hydrolase activator NlpD
MAAETSCWGRKFFPEIRICFAAKAPFLLAPWAQAVMLSLAVVSTAALAYLDVKRIGYKQLAASREIAIARGEAATADLKDDVIRLQGKLSTLAEQGRASKDALAQQQRASENAASSEDARIVKLRGTLDQTRQALQGEQSENATLTARLNKSEADRAMEIAQFAQYRTSLEQTVRQLQQLGPVRGRTAGERFRLRLQLDGLWLKLSQLLVPLPGQPVGVVTANTKSAPPTNGVANVINSDPKEIKQFEHALASAGVDANRLLAQFGAGPAEGGPFVPPPSSSRPREEVDPKKLGAIRGLAKLLPLAAPLGNYQIGSPFGPRIDPFNGRPAFHTGIDMDAPYRSPVYATGPGAVIYVGYLGEYGKVVEIDHGFGINTLYAHLQRYFVSVRQQVAAQAEIGLVGTSGRSSGPHVHYEVRVDGQPQDPEKFFELSRLIPIAVAPLNPEAAPPAGSSR